MAQDHYGQHGGGWRDGGPGYGRRGWPEGGRENFGRGDEGRAFGPRRPYRSGEDRAPWDFDDRRGAQTAWERDVAGWRRREGEPGRDEYAFADYRGEGRREFGRSPGRFDQPYPGPDLSAPWAERLGEAPRFRTEDHRGRGPRGYRRTDERIREDVCDRLTDDPHLDARNMEVEVKNGEVILNGSVDSREDKRRAEMIVEMCSGVENVQNNLRAHGSQSDNLRQHA